MERRAAEREEMTEYNHNDALGYRVFRTYRSFHESMSNLLGLYGITPSQWGVLNKLVEHGPVTQAQLAKLVQRQPATITTTVDHLVKAGLVVRTPSPDDRRINIVSIQPEAQAMVAEIGPRAHCLSRAYCEGIPEEDLEVFNRVLDSLYRNSEAVAAKIREQAE